MAINFPEPAGSSPPLKPPGKHRIWDWSIACFIRAIESLNSWEERLQITISVTLAPQAVKARAVSYSQLVPGKTGMSTLGVVNLAWER